MNKLAICFSGQGSQYKGMALDFYENSKRSKQLIDDASKYLNMNLVEAFNDEEKLGQTDFVQPLIVLKSILGLEALEVNQYHVDAYFGFSLGEYSAYYASQVFSLNDILSIVKIRGEVMQKASMNQKGSMAAIIGLNHDQVLETIQPLKSEGVIEIANENGFKQFVISGEQTLVEKATPLLKEKGARRAVVLNVSGAFHTSLMDEASNEFMELIKKFKRHHLQKDMLMNLDASWLNNEEVDKHLKNQMTHSVKYIDMIKRLKSDGYTHVLEIGPGRVLTGLTKKIDLDMEVLSFDTYETLNELKGWLEEHGFKK